jgi:viroplasmin and RNaseH domain-containing protein
VERSRFGLLTKNYSIRGDAHPLVTGFKFKSPKPPFQGFVTLAEAEAYMAEMGVENYEYKIKDGAGETTRNKGQTAYYAVANGRNPGIQTYY